MALLCFVQRIIKSIKIKAPGPMFIQIKSISHILLNKINIKES